MNRLSFRISVFCLLGVLAVVAFPQPCFACSCVAESTSAGGWTRDTLLADYDVVFLGRVVDVGPMRDLGGGATDGTYRVTFAASEVWEGSVQQHYLVQAGSGGGDCTISFQRGQEWLIYGYTGRDGTVDASICSRTTQNPRTATGGDLSVLGTGTPITLGLEESTSTAVVKDRSPIATSVAVGVDPNSDNRDLPGEEVPPTNERAMNWPLAGIAVVSVLVLALLLGTVLRRRSRVSE